MQDYCQFGGWEYKYKIGVNSGVEKIDQNIKTRSSSTLSLKLK